MSELSLFEYFLAGLSSFIVVALLTPLFRRIALSINFVDSPNLPHKTHRSPIPYMGGVAIMIGVMSIISIATFSRANEAQAQLALSIFLPAAALGVIGLIDDKYALSPLSRFLAQTTMGVITASIVVSTNSSGNPTGVLILDVVISTLWVVGVSNSVNFFDNVDGGASGAIAIISTGIFMIALFNNQFLLAAVSIVTLGATASFLLWNSAPARIYMGDAGALFLGFIISVLTIRLDPEVESKALSFSVPLLLLAIPILDTSVAVTSRIRRGLSPFKGGRDHLSHRLMSLGLKKQSAVFLLWALTFVFVALSVATSLDLKVSKFLPFLASTIWVALFLSFLRIQDFDVP